MTTAVRVARAGQADAGDLEQDLAQVLVDCVDGGASVGFLAPLAPDAAAAFWRASLGRPEVLTWVARLDRGPVIGVVQLVLATPENGRHRATVEKLLVHRDARGRGVARALMGRLEEEASALGRWLLLLDTETGSRAQMLYERWGWRPFGVIDDYAAGTDGHLAPTTFLVKQL